MFQVNDRVLYRGWIYRVTAPMKIVETMFGERREMFPVKLMSSDGDRSICGLSPSDICTEHWWENQNPSLVGFMWGWRAHVPAEDADRARAA